VKTAVILAGGLGTRLYPVTYEIPKPLIPVRGRTLTEHVLDVLKEHGITHIILAIGHMAEKIQRHFGDGATFGVTIEYLVETEPLGTGGWMHLMQERGLVPEEDFIVVNGDNLLDLDFHAMHALHKKEDALITLSLHEIEDVTSSGVVAMAGNKITAFVEKPKKEEAPSNRISAGYYIFSPGVFSHHPRERKFMLERHLFPQLAAKGKVIGFLTDAQWFDTGTFDRWDRVIKEWRK